MASRENPVNWLLGNREFLALLFVAVAWLAQRFGLTKDKKPTLPGGTKEAAADNDEAERTRRVQEEIRRKISERRAEAPPPVFLRPAAAEPAPRWGEILQTDSEEPREESSPARDGELEAILDRQRELEKKMRRLESASSAASAQAGGISADRPASPLSQPGMALQPVSSAPPYGWLALLREREGARRAIVLREVLGPPVGLR
jgi:hypothetical protein